MGVMRRRMVGRQVVRAAATTAVVVGTAHAVNKGLSGSSQQAAPQEQYAPQEQMEPEVVYVQAPPAPAAAPAPEVDVMAQLTQYSKMHDAGVITDEEFAAVKAKLLGI